MPAAHNGSRGLRFSVLGPVRVWRGDEELDLGPPQQRLILAVLLVHAGQPVPLSELIGALWGEDAPASAANVVHRNVGQLRRVLEPGLPLRATGEWLLRDGGGYRLRVGEERADVPRFRLLVGRARDAVAREDPTAAVRLFVEALGLWHDRCAAGLRRGAGAEPVFAALDRECLAAAAEMADVALECGAAGDVLDLLRALAPLDPLNEELHARLVLVLAAEGHRAEALAVHRAVVGRLADELGIDPGPRLRAAHEQLIGEEGQDGRREQAFDLIRPAQLPNDLPTFSGRDAELTGMLTALRDGHHPMALALIDGMPGAGKTTVAVRFAREAADAYPDGQLFVNLRGFDPSGSVMETAEALRGFLYALGMPSNRIPPDLDAQTGLYRSLLRGKRMLVVLDNARDVDHVLPLIPGAPDCLTIVTSRNRLTGLVAAEGARPFTLDPMPVAEARTMVALRLGAARSAAEPGAVDEIVAMCGRLPLALAVVSARAAAYPDVPLSAIARELRDAQGGLDAFSYDDTSDLRAVFSWSYRTLSPRAARLFRLLARHWGPDISLPASASLLGVDVRTARAALGELTRTRLMTEHRPGRFQFHDLIRVYGLELGDALDTEEERGEALRRTADHYLHSAHGIGLVLQPHQPSTPHDPVAPGVTPEVAPNRDRAMAWFRAEQHVLHNFVDQAPERGFADHAWRIAVSMQEFFQRQGVHLSWAATTRAALRAARSVGDQVGEARTLRSLAGAHYFMGDTEGALAHLRRTAELLDRLGWVDDQAYVQRNIGDVLARRGQDVHGDHAGAYGYYERAHRLYRDMGHVGGVAISLEGMGVCALRLGRTDEALDLLGRAMEVFRRSDDLNGQANCWAEFGEAHLRLHRYDEAVDSLQRAVDMHRAQASLVGEVGSLVLLGDAHVGAGDPVRARALWQEASALVENSRIHRVGPSLFTPEEVRKRIARLDRA
ncbi:BTAD domain-containing putative transcriptional regulator [Umezawaea sp. Da 62-37]|uniref:AfsR/SARP family transcriptional regulator n=1 Tax=Umezawaea sp. Da 62-37 TaxID=3075927 RepID=UPI0028F6CC8A|nr:BTAD domain-containing putative transcriptional regulator [Umezawaea sp. Da 62-37]WNV82670.1 BTAD domain-containing putative transcriptional regulator [Umezawaea sp. Da 62-37]